MHARYVRVWASAGLLALALSVPLHLLSAARGATLLVVGASYLALALALGLLPAFARRDHPSPLFALAGPVLGALGVAALALPRAFHALLGASLAVGALQPAFLLLSPRWKAPRAPDPHRATDRAALGALVLALGGAGAGGLLLVALPRELPHAALAVLLLACALPAALGALVFMLPRDAGAPLSGATLAHAATVALALAAGGAAWAFARPFAASFRTPVALVALAYALAITLLLRAQRPAPLRGLLAGSFVLGLLAATALLVATLYGDPNSLLPAALYAHVALALVLIAAALALAAPILLPGRAREGRWRAWAPALMIAALFLLTPAIQYDRGVAPAAVVGALGLAVLLWGLLPVLSSRSR